MSLQVLITPPGGDQTDVTDYLFQGQFQVGRVLGGEGASCSFSLVGYTGSVTMADVLATWNGTPIYRGQVKQRRRKGQSSVTFLSPECVDAVTRMRRRRVAETYQETAASAILQDLLTKYLPDVALEAADLTGAVLDMPFNYVTLLEAINRVGEAVGAFWYLSPDNVLRLFTSSFDLGTIPAFSPAHIFGDTFEDDVATSEFANRVWVLGSKQASQQYKTQTFAGDSDVFTLAYEPNYTEVRVNGGPLRQVHLKENIQTGTEFVVDKKRKAVESRIALTGADLVAIRYRPTIEVVDFFEDQTSIRTYGLYETVIKDRKITDKLSARQRGHAALRRSVVQRPTLSWQSRQVWQVYPGQRCSVSYPQFDIDGIYRLTDVDVQFQWLGHRWDVVANLKAEGL